MRKLKANTLIEIIISMVIITVISGACITLFEYFSFYPKEISKLHAFAIIHNIKNELANTEKSDDDIMNEYNDPKYKVELKYYQDDGIKKTRIIVFFNDEKLLQEEY